MKLRYSENRGMFENFMQAISNWVIKKYSGMKKLNFYTLLLGVILLGSCKDYLDEAPVNNLILENAVTDYSGAKNALNGMYCKEQSGYFGGSMMVPLSSMSGCYTGNVDLHYNMAFKQGTAENTGQWSAMYSAINAANATITAISGLAVDKFPSPEIKKAMVAEAKLYRAWNYSWLLWTRCHWWANDDDKYGLVYRDQMSNLSNLQVPRLTVGQSYKKIFEDVDEAILNAPVFRSSMYLSKEMASVLKAKLLLYRGKGNDYKDALMIVRSLKSKAIIEPNLKKLYEDAWDSKEVLWARYMEPNNRYDYPYAGGLIYNAKYNTDFCDGWLKNDPRYPQISGMVRSPDAWLDKTYETLSKLTQRGLIAGPNDKYATYYFRWAELYLMESELIARTGGAVTAALAPLNEFRAKRTSITLPAFTTVDAPSLNAFYDLLFKEIWVELCLENGSEWFASLRFMKNEKPWVYTLKPDVSFDENKYCWPIPDVEMKNNKLVFQNPGE